jgi:hypothetical protein
LCGTRASAKIEELVLKAPALSECLPELADAVEVASAKR